MERLSKIKKLREKLRDNIKKNKHEKLNLSQPEEDKSQIELTPNLSFIQNLKPIKNIQKIDPLNFFDVDRFDSSSENEELEEILNYIENKKRNKKNVLNYSKSLNNKEIILKKLTNKIDKQNFSIANGMLKLKCMSEKKIAINLERFID
jgi:hypothetical protein